MPGIYPAPARFSHAARGCRRAVCLVLFATLSACLPLETPPAPALTPAPTFTASVTLTPSPVASATATPSPAHTPRPACLFEPGQVLDGVVESNLLPKQMTYRIYLPPCYAEE